MASNCNADACYSLNGQLPDDLQWGWWEWGNNHMYHRCLQLARYDWSTILCGGRALLPDFCTVAHMWAPYSFSSYFPFFLVHNFPSFSIEGIHKEIFVWTNTSVMVASHQIWKTKKGQVSPYTFFSLAEEAEMCFIVNHFNCLFQRRVVGTLVWKRMQSMQQYLYHRNTLCTG